MTEVLPKSDNSEFSSIKNQQILAANYYELSGNAARLCSYFDKLNEDEAEELMLALHKFGERSVQVNNLLCKLDSKYEIKKPEPELSEGMQELLDHD